jgi:hypothetical protein
MNGPSSGNSQSLAPSRVATFSAAGGQSISLKGLSKSMLTSLADPRSEMAAPL